ncbi:hypothetical protein VPH35_018676 [Triticum aestivum]
MGVTCGGARGRRSPRRGPGIYYFRPHSPHLRPSPLTPSGYPPALHSPPVSGTVRAAAAAKIQPLVRSATRQRPARVGPSAPAAPEVPRPGVYTPLMALSL